MPADGYAFKCVIISSYSIYISHPMINLTVSLVINRIFTAIEFWNNYYAHAF